MACNVHAGTMNEETGRIPGKNMRANKVTILQRAMAILVAACLTFVGAFSGASGLFGVFSKGGSVANAADSDEGTETTTQTLWVWTWDQPQVIQDGNNTYYEYPLYNFAERGHSGKFYRMKVTTIRMKEVPEENNPFSSLDGCVGKFGTGNNINVDPKYYLVDDYVPDKTITVVDNNDSSYNGTYVLYTEFTPDPLHPGQYYRLDPVLNTEGSSRIQFFGNKLGGSGGWVKPNNWPDTDPTIKKSFHRDYVIWLCPTKSQTLYNFIKVSKNEYYRLNKQTDGIFGATADRVEKEKTLDPELWPSLVEPYDFSNLQGKYITYQNNNYYYYDSAMAEAGIEIPKHYFTINGNDYSISVYNRFTTQNGYDDDADKYWLATDRAADWGSNSSSEYRYHRDFTVTFHERANTYTATFKTGTDEWSDTFQCGTAPIYGGEALSGEDDDYIYIFAGWKAEDGTVYGPNDELPVSFENVTYQAVIETQTKITITAKDTGKQFGAAEPELEWEVDKDLSEDDLATLHVQVSRVSGEEIGPYVITVSGDEVQGKYHITYVNGTFTISQATDFTVTLEGSTYEYDGDAKHITNSPTTTAGGETTYTYSFEEDGTYVADLASLAKTDAGTYTVYVKATNPNYSNPATTTATLTISKASGLTVSLEGSEFTYDGKAKCIENSPTTNAAGGETTYTYSFEENGTYVDDLSSLTETKVGAYTVYVKATNPNYSSTATTTATLKIKQKELTITAGSDSKVYDGTELTAHTYTNTPLAEGDAIESIKITGSQREIGSSNNVPSAAKIFTATGEDVTSCYDITYANGTLKVTPREVTIKANDQNKKYGESDPDFDATVTGLAQGDDETALTYEVSCEHDEDAGVYVITVTAETEQGNYIVKTENAAFTIGTYNGVIVKIVGGTKTTVYDGTEQTVEGFTVTMESGLYTFNDFKFTGYAAATAKDVGKTDMGLSADQFVNMNTNFSEVAFIVTDGWLLIDPAEAKVTAKDTKKVYGDKDPELTAETTGVFGDDKLTYEITRETGENIGAYGISVGGDEVQGNYVVSYEGGEFTIERREITVKADDIVKTYGKGDPDLTVTIENMPGEYTVSLDEMLKAAFVGAPIANMSVRLPGTLRPFGRSAKSTNYKASAGSDVIRFTVSREEGEDVGTYKITVTGEEIQGNYKVAFAEGTFEVVTASDLELTNLTPKSVVYDGKEHPLEVEASVTAGTKIEYSTDGGTTWSATAPALTNAGTVKVKVRATNPNLGDADLDVEFTIEPKAATVRVKDASKKAGEADPAWETETEGLVGSDKLTFTVARAAGEDVGEYAIKASGEATQGNYTVTFVDGKLTITNAGGDVPSPKTADTMPIALLAAVLLAALTTAALAAKKRRESAE